MISGPTFSSSPYSGDVALPRHIDFLHLDFLSQTIYFGGIVEVSAASKTLSSLEQF